MGCPLLPLPQFFSSSLDSSIPLKCHHPGISLTCFTPICSVSDLVVPHPTLPVPRCCPAVPLLSHYFSLCFPLQACLRLNPSTGGMGGWDNGGRPALCPLLVFGAF